MNETEKAKSQTTQVPVNPKTERQKIIKTTPLVLWLHNMSSINSENQAGKRRKGKKADHFKK